ncbi:hypothetical protein QBC43DRAFT_18265 [Cladorrhinum sp. PSN259]|nr:hypothetical protein QBC43DRAFT_18265 [Cladorrhinum sp. PSN259]
MGVTPKARAWDHGRTDPTSLAFVLTCWVYCHREGEDLATESISNYLNQSIPSTAFRFRRDESSETEYGTWKQRDEHRMEFLGLKVLCTAAPGTAVTTEADCYKCENQLQRFLKTTISTDSDKYTKLVGAEHKVITWSLDPSWGWSSKLSVFDLTSRYRAEPNPSPAGRIELAVKRLVSLKADGGWQRDKTHDKCRSSSVLNCIKSLLGNITMQRKTLDDLDYKLQRAEKNGTLPAAMQDGIDALVAINQASIAIIFLLREHVGRKPSRGGWGIWRILCRLFSSKFLTVPIDDPSFNDMRKTIESHRFRCMAQTVAAHIRLHDSKKMTKFCTTVSQAPTLQEKQVLPEYIGLSSSFIGNRFMHSLAFLRVCEWYTNAVDTFLGDAYELMEMAHNLLLLDKKGRMINDDKASRKAWKRGWEVCDVEREKPEIKMSELAEYDSDDSDDLEWDEKKT